MSNLFNHKNRIAKLLELCAVCRHTKAEKHGIIIYVRHKQIMFVTKEGEVMKGMTPTEIAVEYAKADLKKEIYIKAIEAQKAGKSFEDFIKELEALATNK
mgnify:CR=1 FL=1